MKILITGARGFIGKNLVSQLRNINKADLLLFDVDTNIELLDQYTKNCDFVFHLAGVNRPKNTEDFMTGNFGFTSLLLDSLKKNNNKAPVLITSSIQAEMDNPYGISKKAGEDLLINYGHENNVSTFIYRLPNVFGKWCRPNYNSAVATFCHNIANDLPIQINDASVMLSLVYIDDVVSEFLKVASGTICGGEQFYTIPTAHTVKLGDIVELLYSFKDSRKSLFIPNMGDPFIKKLYSTYLSYLPENQFSYPLKMNVDNRGSFTEVFKTQNFGQVSVNISKPNITKGNHWHHTKNEKFVVISGKGIIRFRNIDSQKIIEYNVSGDKLEVIDIPVGYTHNIENLGDTDMVTLMWANEPFDPLNPDTYYLEV